MSSRLSFLLLLTCSACSSDPASSAPAAGGAAGGGQAGMAGAAAVDAGGVGGQAGQGGATAGSSGAGTAGAGTAGLSGGTGSLGGAGAAGAAGGGAGNGGAVNHLPADYEGTPYQALQIPGTVNAADYDRGGAGVAWCHDAGNCAANRVTGDWFPPNSAPYRAPLPQGAQVCGGAACDDNVGVCRMSTEKPDNTIDGAPMPANATYLCYSVASEWTKYTVTVAEPGTYSVEAVVAVPQNGAFKLSFGDGITTGDVPLAVTPTTHSGSGESFHSWDARKNLASVTLPTAGQYLMTLTQVGRFNASSFTFTKP